MRRRKLIKKFFLTLTAAVEIILINAPGASALSVSSIAKDLEERYHLNLESIQNQGENFNVADTKKMPPQVMLFFNPTDPKAGEKLTAEALPMYFSNPKESLYYTWYLKHKECDKCNEGDCSKEDLKTCDKDGDDNIDENDWKIEAMRFITNGDFDTSKADYNSSSDKDNDGYEAIWGGDDRDKRFNDFNENYLIESDSVDYAHCYVHDFRNGINYELTNPPDADFNCPAGETAICVDNESLFCPDAVGGSYTEYSVCQETEEDPICDSSGLAECASGTPVCSGDLDEYECDDPPDPANAASCSQLFNLNSPPTCSGEVGSAENLCRHLFPQYDNFDGCFDLGGSNSNVCIDLGSGKKAGDGSFKRDEEAFWKTSPQDPDTADNGNKDEANAVGLGISAFTWNYQPDDEVGVIIEGASMIPTKYDDSSMMIMWAYPKNKCEVERKGEYSQEIKGYSVKIPTAEMNLNDCIEDNLVDPREGGQPKKINVSLSYSPENPLNDQTGEDMGDVIVTQAVTDNAAREVSQLNYDWTVEISSDGTFSSDTVWTDITKKLVDRKLISGLIKGNGLSSLKFKLNLNETNLENFNDYFPNDTGYLRVKVAISENFSSETETSREGKSDVIIKVISSGKKITAHGVGVEGGKLTMDTVPDSDICMENTGGSENSHPQPVCFTIKNAIIGLQYDNPDLENFSWTLNGKPLNCDPSVSDLCNCDASNHLCDESNNWNGKQGNYNFFPATGNVGDAYIVGLTANNITTGKTVSLTRTFQIIDPFVKIVSSDTDIAWRRYLGDYVDLDGTAYTDESESIFETFTGNVPTLKAAFHPDWLAREEYGYLENGFLQLEWTVDGVKQNLDPATVELSLPAVDKELESVYNVSVNAVFRHPPEIRQALKSIWDISQFDTAEKYMSYNIQIEVVPNNADIATVINSPGKFLAGLLSYIPDQITFLLRILLTIAVITVTAGIAFSLTPEPSYENKKTI